MFFKLPHKKASLSDINDELICTYNMVKNDPHAVKRKLGKMITSESEFYKIRESKPRTPTGRAVRFLYLNRTCFCGLYRVNKKGEFNVPYGGGSRTPRVLTESVIIEDASKALRKAILTCRDFESAIDEAEKGDLVYCDPTYVTIKNEGRFLRYNDKVFSWADQERLAGACTRASQRGASVIVSNIACPEIRKMYSFAMELSLTRPCLLSASSASRGEACESVFFAGRSLTDHIKRGRPLT